MSKSPIPFTAPDITVVARNLSQHLSDPAKVPTHLNLMNMLARSAGFRNYQHLRAAHAAEARLNEAPAPPAIDHHLLERTLHQFDNAGQMIRWSSRRTVRDLCLWQFWSILPAGRMMHEKEVNAAINAHHLFGDPAQLRRSLIEISLLTRKIDGSDYRRVETKPPAIALALFERLKSRRTEMAKTDGA
ncbi:hypothetical protein C1J03_05235 [Sulfitobacter sp. SK012]|uniref:DUF2087 domain-containing protein n=1 Tax=Sulfitobacter sp. SK012 TaxID=1389005 RepID=UPI000E0AA673|nr:DUF2087 domain-containing protein [Sulfitobacter sp. SK012]AXI45492.1 hypothetical protein C1J03_05235 [Sulfitobacter sp. SK012]